MDIATAISNKVKRLIFVLAYFPFAFIFCNSLIFGY